MDGMTGWKDRQWAHTPYRFVIWELHGKRDGAVTDVAKCEWSGQCFKAESRHGVTMALARQLIVAGAPDGHWEAYGRNGHLRLSGPSIQRLAALTIKETDAGQFRFARYEEWSALVSGAAPDGGFDVGGSLMPEAA